MYVCIYTYMIYIYTHTYYVKGVNQFHPLGAPTKLTPDGSYGRRLSSWYFGVTWKPRCLCPVPGDLRGCNSHKGDD